MSGSKDDVELVGIVGEKFKALDGWMRDHFDNPLDAMMVMAWMIGYQKGRAITLGYVDQESIDAVSALLVKFEGMGRKHGSKPE